MMKKLFITLSLSLLSLSAMAGDRWLLIAHNDVALMYIDTETIRTQDNYKAAWVKYLVRKSKIKQQGHAELKVLTIFSCADNTFKPIQSIKYDLNGNPIGSWTEKTSDKFFQEIIPESLSEFAYKFVCQQ